MADFLARLETIRRSGLAAPLLLMSILAMMVIPLAPAVLDLMFTMNITLSIVILLSVIYVMRPLEFSAFPTVMLFATLLRLALNVASTRVVLLNGHEGGAAAGRVIEAFGAFVIGGNYAVGLVVFVILTIVNFMVVTKGAERVSEVSARFVLDALPGRQMAIDADLNAGLLTREEAKIRREDVRSEADFYGSMDGASKFVRGDALAGILILVINIVGGLLIGTMQHGLAIGEAAKVYTLLTIGDGLVAQVPALLVSTAVAVLVTRMSRQADMSTQVVAQLFSSPRVLAVTAGVLGIVGMIPGMPNVVFLLLAAVCGVSAWVMVRRRQVAAEAPEPEAPPAPPAELSWEDVPNDDVLGLEVGYRLIPMVDTRQGGELMARIKGVRKKLTQEMGFLIPPVHIRDNLELQPSGYRLLVHGVPIAEGQVYPEREMALNPGRVFGKVDGIATRDPAFGLEAVWIDKGAREHAQSLGYTVVDCSTVIATHLSHVIKSYAHELMGHDEAQSLLTQLAKSAPKLAEDLVPKVLPLAVFVKVLQNLLAERVPIRNMRVIAESLAEHGPKSQDPVVLSGLVRIALGRQIVQEINGLAPEIPVMTLSPTLEQVLQDSLKSGGSAIEPGLAERMHRSLSDQTRKQETTGQPAVLLVPPPLRPLLARFTRQTIPGLHVLAYDEVPDDKQIRMVGAVS
ncbi:flagellar biosynthesis protein FlhA [Sinimarinibacterium sp. CAU 1509]|uniref:flagellar biosynthesis protein FlhA n=1 Tax=Sinimarinibacterium sp. CAU 1509 TaxID=2562283 RepID=UPI0010ABC363|nr:flagellar biosynthesis protein FlhA [Sinimarinibacterium sp. CAU 1509]TJY62841.1 flagellar biosynthesis protein FlhA [Sinimarinibacterium sp. CAU 1509]